MFACVCKYMYVCMSVYIHNVYMIVYMYVYISRL